jgi:hypothetical protein
VTAAASTQTVEALVGLELVTLHRVVIQAPLTRFQLRPGDRPLVGGGETVTVGTPLAELLHDRRLIDVPASVVGDGARTGAHWDGHPRRGVLGRRRGRDIISGELLFEVGGRWRLAVGEPGLMLEAPASGIVRDIRPGVGIALQVAGSAIDGVRAIGAPARGRLEVAGGGDGDVRATGLDVGRAGAILVIGGRVDAETLTRARAMGIRGIVVGSLTAKDLRDYAASEARQRASLHRLPPFAVLVLDGAIRRGVASPVRAALAALAGHDVAIAADPPQLLFDPGSVRLPPVAPDLVRVRQGAWGGREGRWVGPAGLRQFRGRVRLESGFVRFDDGPPVALPLADLERFA